ncbi:hypothetical protein L3X38_011480 [Prunus dulcis]|uniref:Uncharacterized protein n=1 Tax=Prunus dulcis TaxID=3755 RepID=A0AAD4WHV4_PRUDU|nr:hypothetical protein L3X38_011480 [Prunus dulcis]
MSDLSKRRRAVTTTQSSEPPTQPTSAATAPASAATAPALMDHLAVGPAGSQTPALSASSVAQPVSARRHHRPTSTTDTTSTDASGSQPVLSFHMGLVGVSSTVDTCPDRFKREFRGYLSESAGCADWSPGTVCRRLVRASPSIALIDLLRWSQPHLLSTCHDVSGGSDRMSKTESYYSDSPRAFEGESALGSSTVGLGSADFEGTERRCADCGYRTAVGAMAKPKGLVFNVDFLEPNALNEAELAKIRAEFHIPDSMVMQIPGPLESLSDPDSEVVFFTDVFKMGFGCH